MPPECNVKGCTNYVDVSLRSCMCTECYRRAQANGGTVTPVREYQPMPPYGESAIGNGEEGV